VSAQRNIAKCLSLRKTSLKNIEDHRLEELIRKDITAYPSSSLSEVHQRIGEEINVHKVKRMLKIMVETNILNLVGTKRWAKYSIKQNVQENA